MQSVKNFSFICVRTYLPSTQSAAAAHLIFHHWIRGDTAACGSTHQPVRIPETGLRKTERKGWMVRKMDKEEEREGEGGELRY